MVALAIGIATRGRPHLASWTATETLKNVRGDTRVYILADDDDAVTFDVPEGVTLSVEPREDSVGGKWNRLLGLCNADVYMAMCDYRTQITPGFDLNIIKASKVFEDGIGCVYQHLANLSFPCYQAVTAKMAEIMGHFYVEYFPYWFVDHWLDDICKMTGRFVYAAGDTKLGNREGGTQEFREPRMWATLYDALYLEREEISERLLAHMDEAQWRKNQLRQSFPLVHQRSRMLNDLVRSMSGDLPLDDRYKRIRGKAAEKMKEAYALLEAA